MPINAHFIPSVSEWIAALGAGVSVSILDDLLRPYLLAFLGLAWWKMRRWWIVIRERFQAVVPRMIAKLALPDWIAI